MAGSKSQLPPLPTPPTLRSTPEKTPPVADSLAQVHRCRFVEWTPHAIRFLNFDASGKRLAVVRDNGDIDIRDVENGWFCERVIPGSGQAIVRAALWIPPMHQGGLERLLSVGLNGRLVEWDLSRLIPKFVVDAYGGAIWCAALNPSRTRLCVGCEDGSLRIFDIPSIKFPDALDSGPAYVKALSSRHNGRVLCICWKREDLIISGGLDGTIRQWNFKSGRNVSTITVENIRKSKNFVWTLDLLGNTIVSGDSLGHVQLWELPQGVLRQTFHEHKADILAIACLPSEDAFYASGVDNLVCEFRRSDQGKWIMSSSYRPHSHDVHALAISPPIRITAKAKSIPDRSPLLPRTGGDSIQTPYTTTEPVLVSGGVDTQLLIHPSSRFGSEYVQRILPLPHRVTVSLGAGVGKQSTRKLSMLVHYEGTLDVYQLATASKEEEEDLAGRADINQLMEEYPDGEQIPTGAGYTHLLRINTNTSSAPPPPQQQQPDVQSVEQDLKKAIEKIEKKEGELEDNLDIDLDSSDEETGVILFPDVNKEKDKRKQSKNDRKKGAKEEPEEVKIEEPSASRLGLNLCCSCISPDGLWLACSDPVGVKLFRVKWGRSSSLPVEGIIKFDVSSLLPPCYSLTFSRDSTRLIGATFTGEIIVLQFIPSNYPLLKIPNISVFEIITTFSQHTAKYKRLNPSLTHRGFTKEGKRKEDNEDEIDEKHSKRSVKRKRKADDDEDKDNELQISEEIGVKTSSGLIRTLQVSPNGQWLASGDDQNDIHIFDLKALERVSTLPKLPSPHTCINFHPSKPIVVVVCTSYEIYLYDFEKNQFTDWTKRNLELAQSSLSSLQDVIFNIFFSPANPNVLFLQSSSCMAVFRLDQDLPRTPALARRRSATKPPPVRIIEKFKPLLYSQITHSGIGASGIHHAAMITVEVPWLSVLQRLPDPLYRRKFGKG